MMHRVEATTRDEAIQEQLRSSSRVSFDTYDAFATFENELKASASPNTAAQSIARKFTSYRSPRDSNRNPNFKTLPRASGKLELQTDAARRNDAIRTPYKAPCDYSYRVDSPASSWYEEDTDFQAKFVLPSAQDLRRSTALDQEGFFGPANGEDLLPVSLRFQQSIDQRTKTSSSRAFRTLRARAPTWSFDWRRS
uniref:Uncharacterized protein n=1 Tax=Globisporangium ultimum (strain ATCC 200006 / CBS 805.95 / DAOM BR144) TaxID=431595 RepID=K3XC54_GLOUD